MVSSESGERATFRSLQVRNFRLFVAGHAVSQAGSWLQLVALSWVALELTGEATALGWVMLAAFGPMPVLAPWVGSLADRFDRHALLIGIQVAAAAQAAGLGALVLGGALDEPRLYLLTLVHGVIHAFETPVRRAFVADTVTRPDVINATSVASTVSAMCRVAGPAMAGLILIGPGAAWCFLANAVSYLVALAGLLLMRPAELHGSRRAGRRDGSVREGLRYAWRVPELRITLVLTAVVCTVGFNHQVVIPLLAQRVLAGGAGTYSLLYTALTVGAVVGGLLVARRDTVDAGYLGRAGIAFGASTGVVAVAPDVGWAAAAAAVTGATGLLFVCASTALLQLRCDPAMRGRVLALSAVVVLGGIPIGGPLIGWLCEVVGVRWALGAAALVVAGAGAVVAGRAAVVARTGSVVPTVFLVPTVARETR